MSTNRLLLKAVPVLSPFELEMIGVHPKVEESLRYKYFRKKIQKSIEKVGFKLSSHVKIIFVIYKGEDSHRVFNIFACASSVIGAIAMAESEKITKVIIEKIYTTDREKTGIYIENLVESLTNY